MSVSSSETRQGIFAMLVSLPMAAGISIFALFGAGLIT